MSLLAVLDEAKYTGLEDESIKNLYKLNENTKQYFLNLPESEAEKLTFNLNDQIVKKEGLTKKAFDERNEAVAKLTAFENLGKSADEIKAELASGQPEAINEIVSKYEADKKAIKDSYDAKIGKLETQVKKQDVHLTSSLKNQTKAKLISKYDLVSEDADIILDRYLQVETTENGDKSVIPYFDGIKLSVVGETATPDQLVEYLVENKKHQSMFKANNGGGSGANPNQHHHKTGNIMKRSDWDALPPQQQKAFVAKVQAGEGKLID